MNINLGRRSLHWSVVVPLLVITGGLIVVLVHPDATVQRIGGVIFGAGLTCLVMAGDRLTRNLINDRNMDRLVGITESALAERRSRAPANNVGHLAEWN